MVNQDGQFRTNWEPRKALSTFFRNQSKVKISLVSIYFSITVLIR